MSNIPIQFKQLGEDSLDAVSHQWGSADIEQLAPHSSPTKNVLWRRKKGRKIWARKEVNKICGTVGETKSQPSAQSCQAQEQYLLVHLSQAWVRISWGTDWQTWTSESRKRYYNLQYIHKTIIISCMLTCHPKPWVHYLLHVHAHYERLILYYFTCFPRICTTTHVWDNSTKGQTGVYSFILSFIHLAGVCSGHANNIIMNINSIRACKPSYFLLGIYFRILGHL